ncbi:segregation/condensation protein A [Brevibacillus sp. 7WMA2]|uniref:Segregation and condensation protein A n=1 Tax=Brevibacillus laterosporus LMG 15441 TaxID=1042163 RepID=A0A075R3V0_BRELA|nr:MULTISPECIES: segregation/condensation protein A [Brevibacillus]AIG26161.1 segregation and condensation protein A [Brevibacillus laterosporus LMG 15441]AUM64743.1 segregation/condensation protein A [Brevibacillus laterosporus]AYK07662.1 segregation/condensation protein A [Brevibacillus laterosporus]ERM20234.1 segregation and condensation protein A [Brevibacillus laterosporus PE36]MBA4534117.1 segregation/condensation protein A [Brevibacillus halotolerans]
MSYSIKLDSFEGPLDLLLHLIDKAEVDIYDIPIAVITEQYLDTIHTMRELQLDVASEFVVMAATLLAIKSKTLLPKKEELHFEPLHDDYGEEEDPRDELVQRLLEYKKFKRVAEQLREMETGRSQVFTRPAEDLTPYVREEEPGVANVTLFDMLHALEKLFARLQTKEPVAKVSRDEISIKDRMKEIRQLIKVGGGHVRFSQLFITNVTRTEIVTTFLALLELMKGKAITCVQNQLFTDILISEGKGETEHGL